jgi:glycosyltransferase involved in cell wall biosynthesis
MAHSKILRRLLAYASENMFSDHLLVTIVMPTYNRAALIGESIQSVLNQTYQNWELIVADDGSTDETEKIVKGFHDSRIYYHRFAHRGGFGIARNRGMKLSKGFFIAFLDSDDLWNADKLAHQLRLFNQYPESAFVFTNVQLFGDTLIQAPEYKDLFNTRFFHILLDEKEVVFYPSTLIFKKSVLEETGWLSEQSATGADHDFILTMSLFFNGCFSNERVAKIRKHPLNTSSSSKIFGYPDSIAHATKFFKLGALSKTQFKKLLGRYYYKMGLALINNSEPKRAVNSFFQHLHYRPGNGKGWLRLIQSIVLSLKKN